MVALLRRAAWITLADAQSSAAREVRAPQSGIPELESPYQGTAQNLAIAAFQAIPVPRK